MSAAVETHRAPFVPLADVEWHIAATVGCHRRLTVMRKGLGRGHGERDIGAWDRHLVGACAELAVAKYLGVYWGGAPDDFGKAGDVAGLEVRATTYANGHLIVYEADPLERIYVLAVVEVAGVTLKGGIMGERAKRIEYTPPPGKQRGGQAGATYWVPPSALVPMERIRSLVRGRQRG